MYKEILQTARSVGPRCSNLSQLLLPGERYRSSDVCLFKASFQFTKWITYKEDVCLCTREYAPVTESVGAGFPGSEWLSVKAAPRREECSCVEKGARLGFRPL